jgi:hypothetical protein
MEGHGVHAHVEEAASRWGGHTPPRVATAPVVEVVRGHLTAECATELDGGPACPACLAYRMRAYTPAGERRWLGRAS